MSLEVPRAPGAASSSSLERRVSQLLLLDHSKANAFDFDFTLDLDPSTTPHSDYKQAGDLAEMFVNSRKTFKADNNILDPVSAVPTRLNQQNEELGHVSKATLIRVERVKSSIALKYLMLERSCRTPPLNDHPGVEGVYNPLQILRNRKIRAKYKEYPKPLSVKTLPLAVNVFSKHNRRRGSKHNWKCFWAIDLNEFVSDPAWRASHWHELRDPHGNLWFPTSSSSSTKNRLSLRNRLHDRLFAADDEDSPSIDDDKIRMIPLNETKAGRRERIKRRIRRNKKAYSLSSDVSLDSVPADLKMTPMESDDSEATEEDDDTKYESAIDGLQIKPIEKREELMLDLSKLEESTTIMEPPKCDVIELDWLNIVRNLTYHGQSLAVSLHFMCHVYPKATSAICEILSLVVGPEIAEMNAQIVEVNDDMIPGHELLCTAFLSEIKSLVHIINDDYSIKIDNLLSSSDRTVGELNTSMSLELKKIDERIERLNNSLFGNVVTEALKEKKLISENSNRRVWYWLLENLIVVALRLTWVVVNIYKINAFILRMLWKVIKVILF